MKTETTTQLIYATVKHRSKCRTIKVRKEQLFVLQNGIKHHLIGNLYYSVLHRRPINIIQEKGICNIVPIVLTKFTFRHCYNPKRKRFFKHMSNLKDY